MSLRASLVSTILVLLLSTAGCGGDPPTKEIQQAQTAVAVAQTAGAEQYAADEYAAAQEALKNANIAVEQRDYRLALNHALDSLERAQNAATQAADAMALARTGAQRAIADATAALESSAARLKTPEAGRMPAKILADAKAALGDADARVQEARAALAEHDYIGASKAASAASQGLKAAFEPIEAATVSSSRRRR